MFQTNIKTRITWKFPNPTYILKPFTNFFILFAWYFMEADFRIFSRTISTTSFNFLGTTKCTAIWHVGINIIEIWKIKIETYEKIKKNIKQIICKRIWSVDITKWIYIKGVVWWLTLINAYSLVLFECFELFHVTSVNSGLVLLLIETITIFHVKFSTFDKHYWKNFS